MLKTRRYMTEGGNFQAMKRLPRHLTERGIEARNCGETVLVFPLADQVVAAHAIYAILGFTLFELDQEA